MFKQVADGYVFRAPNPFVFGRARFYLVDEAQKAQLLAIITARSPLVFWSALVALIAASTAMLALGTGHDHPTMTDLVIMLALLPLWIYAALLASVGPTARRLQPLLAGVPITDQRITAIDLRKAVRKTISLRQHLVLGISQAILSTGLILAAYQTTNGGWASALEDSGALVFVFAAAAFAASSICFLIAALDKVRHRQDEPVATERSFKSILLPVCSLVVAIGLLGFEVTNTLQKNERAQKSALIRERMETIRITGSLIRSGQDSLKLRAAANAAHMSGLIAKLENPSIRCEPAATTADPARLASIHLCSELARREQDAIQGDIAASRKESDVIRQDNAAMQKQVDAFRTQVDAIEAEIRAIRR